MRHLLSSSLLTTTLGASAGAGGGGGSFSDVVVDSLPADGNMAFEKNLQKTIGRDDCYDVDEDRDFDF
jgi:hypothetical protein